MVQIKCVEWLAGQELEPDGMLRVLTHVTDLRERPRLSDDDTLQLLRRLGVVPLARVLSLQLAAQFCCVSLCSSMDGQSSAT